MSNQFHFKRSCQLLHRSLLLLVGMAIVLSITTQPGHAAQSQPELNVQIGVAGTYMIGCWTEVRVQTTGVPDQLHLVQVSVLDADGNIVQYRSVPNKADSTGKYLPTCPYILDELILGLLSACLRLLVRLPRTLTKTNYFVRSEFQSSKRPS
ncbi:MAG: hypothetical protein JKY95_18865 [Planctomycetaceae bacterium]|nr:hypothetical protein [Planctomycetaceae bacterium]